jgi:KRAB domain-containing zinc finger protein
MRIHTWEKGYSCALCDYRATHKTNLNRHMRKHN